MAHSQAEQNKKELLSTFDKRIAGRKRRKATLVWLRYAAVFIGVLVTTSTYFYVKHEATKGPLPQEVTVTLGDGTTKEIRDKHASGTVLRASGFIATQQGTKIVYQSVDAADARNYFFIVHGAEALVFEVGDNTSRAFVKEKATVGADELMRIMLTRMKDEH